MAGQITRYRELRPISDEFEEEALPVNGLDRATLATDGERPADAMTVAAEWVRSMSEGSRPVLVAYPVAFDWSFLYWYRLVAYAQRARYAVLMGWAMRRRRQLGRVGEPDEVVPSWLSSHVLPIS